MQRSSLSLKGLHAFRAVAHAGTIQKAAERLGQAPSTVSSHLTRLEEYLGRQLFDHAHRPLRLTADGQRFLDHVESALSALQSGEDALRLPQPHGLGALRLGMIDDFDADIGPELTQTLASLLPDCRLTLTTLPSHAILAGLEEGLLDVGITTEPQFDLAQGARNPLLRDPFVIAVPRSFASTPDALVAGQTDLPFLRYPDSQIMGAMVTAQLRRLRITLDQMYEIDSTLSLMGLIAQGGGWAIMTPANYMRGPRFHDRVKLLPFPGKEFARTISLICVTPNAEPIATELAVRLRALLHDRTVAPAVRLADWLGPRFVVRDD